MLRWVILCLGCCLACSEPNYVVDVPEAPPVMTTHLPFPSFLDKFPPDAPRLAALWWNQEIDQLTLTPDENGDIRVDPSGAGFSLPIADGTQGLELAFSFFLEPGGKLMLQLGSAHQLLFGERKDTDSEDVAGSLLQGDQLLAQPKLDAARDAGLWQDVQLALQWQDQQGLLSLGLVLNGQEVYAQQAFPAEAMPAQLAIATENTSLILKDAGLKTYDGSKVGMPGLVYKVYDLPSQSTAEDSLPDFSTMRPTIENQSDSLSFRLSGADREFGLVMEGRVVIPREGAYMFSLKQQGSAQLWIDGQLVVDYNGENEYTDPPRYGTISLSQGEHDYRLLYAKQHRGWKYGLECWVEGPGVARHALHAPGSARIFENPVPQWLSAEEEVVLQRGFVMFDRKKRTHAASVGFPVGQHFNYDLGNMSWLQCWEGRFINTREMWVNRGEPQLAQAGGFPISQHGLPSLAYLEETNTPWPEQLQEEQGMRFKGYQWNEADEPILQYQLKEGSLTDYIRPGDTGRSMQRTLSIAGLSSPAWLLLARSSSILNLGEGSFGIAGPRYMLTGDPELLSQAVVRRAGSFQELVLPITQDQTLSYSITW